MDTILGMLFEIHRFWLKFCGYRLIRVVRYESYDDKPITEGVYRHPSGREKRVLAGAYRTRDQMQ